MAYTDKGGPSGIVPLTGRAQAVLQPKTKQAEFFASTGRTTDGTTAGTAGVTTETTTDVQGGGLSLGFIEDGDYVSYKPVSLKDVTAMRFRVASAGAGGTIEVRTGSPTGTLVGTTETITPTGGWQTFKDVTLNLTTPPTGTNELFLVFRNRGSTQNLFNVNWVEFVGKGAAQTASPELAITATPASGGTAPQAVKFDATATDSDGGTLTYAWDFGVPGTTTDTSTAEDPTYTYAAAGTYTATLTVSDGQGGSVTKTVAVTVNAPSGCINGYKDDFNGGDLSSGWEVIRRDQTLTVADGVLTIPAQAGDVYQTANNAKNIVLRPAPAGAWTFTTKVNFKGLVQYQQAGIMVYGDDDNFTKFDRVSTNAAGAATPVEKFEFINEVAGTPRNAGQDATANLAAGFPNDYLPAREVRRDQHHGRVLDRRHRVDRGRPQRRAAGERQGRRLRPLQRRGDGRRRQVRLRHPRGRQRALAARPRRRLQRHHAGQVPLERDRPRGRDQVHRRQRRHHVHHGRR